VAERFTGRMLVLPSINSVKALENQVKDH